MELRIAGPKCTRSCTWNSYALIRDNVQHFVEQGAPSGRFSALHELESAVDGETCVVDATQLRREVQHAWQVLGDVPLARAAVSLRTRAIMTNCPERPAIRATAAARATGWELPVQEDENVEVRSAARAFFDAVSEATAAAADGELVAVTLEGGRPRHASSPDG